MAFFKIPLTKRGCENRELLIDSFLLFSCLILSVIFPVDNSSLIQLIIRNIFFLVILPALYIKIVLKKNLSDFGLNIRDKKTGLFFGAILFIILIILYYFLFSYTSLQKKYALPSNTIGQFSFFVLYELLLMNILLFSQEFFYRGFMLSTLSRKFGYWSILIQSAVFILFSSLSSGFFWQFSAPIALSVTNGFLAYKSKSFIFPYLSGLLFIITVNSYIIYSINR